MMVIREAAVAAGSSKPGRLARSYPKPGRILKAGLALALLFLALGLPHAAQAQAVIKFSFFGVTGGGGDDAFQEGFATVVLQAENFLEANASCQVTAVVETRTEPGGAPNLVDAILPVVFGEQSFSAFEDMAVGEEISISSFTGYLEFRIVSFSTSNCDINPGYTIAIDSDPSTNPLIFTANFPFEPPTASVSEITASGTPGETVSESFNLFSDFPPINVSTNLGILSTASVNDGGLVTFEFTIPESATAGEDILGFIQAVDQGDGGILEIPVLISVLPQFMVGGPSVDPTSIEQQAAPGETVSVDFAVAANFFPISATTTIGLVSPGSSDFGEFTFTFTVPPEAADGQVYSGTILIVDTNLEVPVLITAAVPQAVEPDPAPTGPGNIVLPAAQPGETLEFAFEVSSDNAPMVLSSSIGTVSPDVIEASRGTATFSFIVPPDAQDGDTIEGTITVSDQGTAVALSIALTITINPTLAERVDLTPSQRSVGGALDNACAALRATPERTAGQEDLLAVCDRVQQAGAPGSFIDDLAPEEVAAQGRAGMQTMRQQMANVSSRIGELRAGASGFSVGGLGLAHNGQRLPVRMFTQALGAGAGDDILAFSRWGAFLNGSAAFAKRGQTANEPGFRSQTLGLTAGLDYRFKPMTVAGIALGHTRTDSSLRNDAGGVDVDGYSLSVYATHFLPRAFYIDGIATVGSKRFDTQRTVLRGADGQSAQARPDGMEYALGLNVGYDFAGGPWTLGLQSSLDFVRVEIESYRERASNPGNPSAGALLSIDSQSIDSKTAEVAAQLSYAQSQPWGVLLYSTRLGLEREFSDNSRRITARFLEDPTGTRFSVLTDEPNRNVLRIGAGLTAQMAKRRAAFIFVESLEGQSNYSLYLIDVGFRMEF